MHKSKLNNLTINIRVWIFLSLLLTVLSYLPVLQAEFTNWDDDIYIIDNQLIHTISFDQVIKWFSTPFLGLYQPLVLMSLAIDYSVDGLNSFVFHLTNLILHLMNTFLVFLFVRKLTANSSTALLTMFLFGLHPVHVESVAWVTERKDVLFSFFYLLSLVLYTHYQKNKSTKLLIFTFIAFLFSLLSKATAVSLPLILLLIDYYSKRRLPNRRLIWEKIPFFILGFAFGLITLYLHSDYGSLVNSSGLSFPARLMLASKGLMYHVSKIIWPVSLSTLNPTPSSFTVGVITECIFYIFVFMAIGFFIYKKKNKEIIFGTVFFLFTIGIFLIPPGVPVIASERYAYIPSIGLLLSGSHFIVRFMENRIKNKSITLIFIVMILGFYGIRTFQQAQIWQSSVVLWNHVIKARGESYHARLNLGNAFRLAKDYDAALMNFNQSIQLNPKHYRAYDNRGHLYLLTGQDEKAIEDFKHSADLFPKSTFALSSLGFIFRNMNQPDSAMHYLNKALLIDPTDPEVYFNRGKIFLSKGSISDACTNLEKALTLGLLGENKTESLDLIREHCR